MLWSDTIYTLKYFKELSIPKDFLKTTHFTDEENNDLDDKVTWIPHSTKWFAWTSPFLLTTVWGRATILLESQIWKMSLTETEWYTQGQTAVSGRAKIQTWAAGLWTTIHGRTKQLKRLEQQGLKLSNLDSFQAGFLCPPGQVSCLDVSGA